MEPETYETEDVINKLTALAVESAGDQEVLSQVLKNLEVASRIKRAEEASELEWNKFNHNVKEDHIRNTREGKVTQSQILASATNLGGILAVLNFERLAVVSSKAIGLIAKIKI